MQLAKTLSKQTQYNRIVGLSSIQLCIALIASVAKQSGPKGTMIANIMLPPDITNSLQDHLNKVQLNAKALKQTRMNFPSSVDSLLDHLDIFHLFSHVFDGKFVQILSFE